MPQRREYHISLSQACSTLLDLDRGEQHPFQGFDAGGGIVLLSQDGPHRKRGAVAPSGCDRLTAA